MKAKKPTYTISYYRTTNGIFPALELLDVGKPFVQYKLALTIKKPYKTDAGAKRGIIRLAKRMGLIK